MSFFFQFPEYFCFDMLCEWIDLEILDQLDSAVCNKTERVSLLNFLSNPDVVLNFDISANSKNIKMYRNDHFMNWMACRLLTFKQLTLLSSNFVFGGHLKYNVNMLRIQSLSLIDSDNRMSDETVSHLFNSCPCLSKFETTSLRGNSVLQLSPSILQQLTVFKATHSTGLTQPSLEYLVLYLRSLVEFEVTTNDKDTNLENVFLTLVSQNPHLRVIHIASSTDHSYFVNHYTDRLLNTITDTCSDLKELVLLNCSHITLPSLHRLLYKHIKTLTMVEIHHGDRHLGSFIYTPCAE
jgi:hypothetical protein